jgi:hypothetical protein
MNKKNKDTFFYEKLEKITFASQETSILYSMQQESKVQVQTG